MALILHCLRNCISGDNSDDDDDDDDPTDCTRISRRGSSRRSFTPAYTPVNRGNMFENRGEEEDENGGIICEYRQARLEDCGGGGVSRHTANNNNNDNEDDDAITTESYMDGGGGEYDEHVGLFRTLFPYLANNVRNNNNNNNGSHSSPTNTNTNSDENEEEDHPSFLGIQRTIPVPPSIHTNDDTTVTAASTTTRPIPIQPSSSSSSSLGRNMVRFIHRISRPPLPTNNGPTSSTTQNNQSSSLPNKSVSLKEAVKFKLSSSNDTNNGQSCSMPSISSHEIVLPGSDLQKHMALCMQRQLYKSSDQNPNENEDECVICMEGFTRDNPRMPTLCGCGENNTFFHLPCLYQWVEGDGSGGSRRHCPSCRETLVWEEF
eukprot:CAMPEP_0195508894 /NCGR_PEP_ID=MMETSP0794_2-20130614/1983_1 /TAXON_ID=515487 /ORGANISM="Stephanopyxis turris, Strain CCMP 815" /LENGTH=375 /DNA_ID=CAMNT_0040635981 /DNA_START=74 /DNA_END=1201 /DNA_ORIENTATION=-